MNYGYSYPNLDFAIKSYVIQSQIELLLPKRNQRKGYGKVIKLDEVDKYK